MTEIQKYKVAKTYKGFELRDYAPFITVSTLEPGNMSSAGNQAFRKLVGYIFGGNSESKSIAMTAPVTEKPVPGGFEVSFVMPADMKMPEMPRPQRENLKITEHDATRIAAIRFTGTIGMASFETNEKKLKELLDSEGIQYDPTPIYARYNAPTTPFFLRRNEVLLSLTG